MPTERGRAQMDRSDAIVAAIEQRLAERVGEDAFGEFKRLFRQVAEDQRSWRA
ncbi:hypothetical protein [Saccharothrix deserti]|uniref:hypothetical protein n=1 Tax=Saccharothrix deserti TaxID=2593674 RepID=UPI00192E523E|nr:hypothetical protein [Saccharothrix deserti]